MRRLALVVSLLIPPFFVACGPGNQDGDGPIVVDPDGGMADVPLGSCETAGDGVCDEPVNCKLGTDKADCVKACRNAGPDKLAMIGAACAHRGMVEEADSSESHYANPDPSDPQAETAHITGWRDEYVSIPSGDNLNQNVARHFRVYVPKSYDPDKAYPLMINMPGHRVSHWILPGYTGLHRSAEANDFIAIFAGQEFRGRWAFWTEWVGSSMTDPPGFCKQKSSKSNPDYTFIEEIVDWTANHYTIDKRRIYTSGHSRGAAMALMAALEMPEIAGANVHSGFTECNYLNGVIGYEWNKRHVPLAFFHGVEDPDICIDCQPGNFCNGRPCSPGMYATDPIVERLKSIGWEEGKNLKYYRIERATHRWQSYLNQQIWHFLASQPLPAE